MKGNIAMTQSQLLADLVRRTREWTVMLLDGFDGPGWLFQPNPGSQHALWLCGHMACAQELLLFQRCCNEPRMSAEFMAHFPIGGPIKSGSAHDWPTIEAVRQQMDAMQEASLARIEQLADAELDEPAFGKDGAVHPHYDTKRGAICHLARHEAFHAGQIAMIRRMQGMPFLR